MNMPVLYHLGKANALYEWTIWTEGDTIYTRYGQSGGKMQTASKKATVKNSGRANATTATQQAELEAAAMHKHKLDRKYSLTAKEAKQPLFLPMLAHSFAKHHNGISYPVFVQPKLDGFRCLAAKEDGIVTLYSRSGDTFDLPHISQELETYLPEGSVVDGELYRHGVPFQKIASWIKKQHPETLTIGYHIYDIPEMGGRNDLEMKDRVALLRTMEKGKWKHITIVPTALIANHKVVLEMEKEFVEHGFEGAIVRTTTGKYQYGYRSYGLLKVKSFDDAEFLITGGQPGVGKMANQCIFECTLDPKNLKAKRFNVVPMGDAKERQAYLINLKEYLKTPTYLKVKFFGKSEDGVPRFPVGLGLREKFDV